jgi:hypothetical protein
MNRNQRIRPLIIFTAILALTILSCAGLSDLPNPFATETPTQQILLRPPQPLLPAQHLQRLRRPPPHLFQPALRFSHNQMIHPYLLTMIININ